MAFAEQAGVVQAGLTAVEPVDEVVHVAPVGGGGAAGEHAVLVPSFHGLAQPGGDHPVVPAQIQRHSLGGHHDPGDAAVAGQPAGAGGGDARPEPGPRRAGLGSGVDQVLQVHVDHHVRLDRPQGRQAARGQGVVGQLHQRIGVLLGAGPLITLGAVGLHDRLDRGLQLLPAYGVQLTAHGSEPIGVPGDDQPPALGGVRFGTVGVQGFAVGLHHLRQPVVSLPDRQRDQRLLDRGQVHPLLGGRSELLGSGDWGDDRDLPGGQATVSEGGGDRGQVFQCPPAADQPGGLGRGEVGVSAQPRAHGLEPVVFGGASQLACPHRAGDLRGELVLRDQQRPQPVQQQRADQRLEVLGGEGLQRRMQLAHHHLRTPSNTRTKSNAGGCPALPECPGQRAVHRSAAALDGTPGRGPGGSSTTPDPSAGHDRTASRSGAHPLHRSIRSGDAPGPIRCAACS